MLVSNRGSQLPQRLPNSLGLNPSQLFFRKLDQVLIHHPFSCQTFPCHILDLNLEPVDLPRIIIELRAGSRWIIEASKRLILST